MKVRIVTSGAGVLFTLAIAAIRFFNREIASRGSAAPEICARQLHAAVWIGREVLHRVRENLVVAHMRQHVVGCGEGRDEQSDLVNRPGDAAC